MKDALEGIEEVTKAQVTIASDPDVPRKTRELALECTRVLYSIKNILEGK